MEVQLSEYESSAIKDIAEKEGFDDFELETTPGASKGDNFLGYITKVSVKDHPKSLELILKSSSKSEQLRKQLDIRNFYLREIYLYETIFPTFEKFLNEHGFTDGFNGLPKIYGSCTVDLNEFVILENLKENGYDLWDRKVPMNAKHTKLVFAEYGKFHAISLAMREKKPELYEKLTKNMNPVIKSYSDEVRLTKMLARIVTNGLKAVKGNQVATDALERFSRIAKKFFLDDLKIPEEKLVVLHGDCWCNNLLFKYEGSTTETPSKVCLIDWQLSSTGSPAQDLSCFFLSCCPKEILSDYQTYLKIYYDSVCEVLRKLDCDPEITFPFSLLEYHWKKYVKFGVQMNLLLMKTILGNAEELPDLSEIAESGKSLSEGFNFCSATEDSYNKRISDIITVCAENGWL